MAIFHCSVKAHSRSKGENATAAAAYRLGLNLTDEQTGVRFDYSRRKDVASAFTLLPENAPSSWSDPAVLWNEAEKAEKRKNSCVSREVLVALPAEFTDTQREELARTIAGDLVDRYGVGVSVGIHRPEEGGANFHAHILMTTRRIGPEGLGEKTRELDDQKQGPGQVEAIRAMVAEHTNEHLQRHGYAERVDHRSLEDQKLAALEAGDLEKAAELSRAPTQHRGRNPHVALRVASENEATKEKNTQSQAEARAVFAELEAKAAAEARLMEPSSDTPKAKAAAEAETKPQRQRREREHARVVLEASQAHQVEARKTLMEKAAEVKEAKEQEAAYSERVGQALEHAHWCKSKAIDADTEVKTWRERHPLRAWLGMEPKPVKEALSLAETYREDQAKAQAQAKKADEKQQAAAEAREKAAREALEAHQRLVEAENAHRVAQEEAEAVRSRHIRENTPPEQLHREMMAKIDQSASSWSPDHIMQIPSPDPKPRASQSHDRERDHGWSMGM